MELGFGNVDFRRKKNWRAQTKTFGAWCRCHQVRVRWSVKGERLPRGSFLLPYMHSPPVKLVKCRVSWLNCILLLIICRVHDHLLSLASPLVPDESGSSAGKTPIAAPPPTFASGKGNCRTEVTLNKLFIGKVTLEPDWYENQDSFPMSLSGMALD